MESTDESLNKPTLLLFDVYETLLDMELVERKVNNLLDSKRGYLFWFELFMQYCFADNSLQTHHRFADIAGATLQMAGRFFGENVSANQADEVLELLNHLPLKEGVTEQLSALYDGGYRIAALTNAAKEIIESRMERTGLVSYFEAVLSAESVGKYKPAREVYEWAARSLDCAPAEILFVSAHGWDVAGAANTGMQTGFLRGSMQMAYPLMPTPTFTVNSLEELTGLLTMAAPRRK